MSKKWYQDPKFIKLRNHYYDILEREDFDDIECWDGHQKEDFPPLKISKNRVYTEFNSILTYATTSPICYASKIDGVYKYFNWDTAFPTSRTSDLIYMLENQDEYNISISDIDEFIIKEFDKGSSITSIAEQKADGSRKRIYTRLKHLKKMAKEIKEKRIEENERYKREHPDL